MRTSPDRYPETVDFYCETCDWDRFNAKVESIEGDDVRVVCYFCGESTYVRVIED